MVAAALVMGGTVAGVATVLLIIRQMWSGVPIAILAGGLAIVTGARQWRRLGRWPASCIGLFRDRLLIVQNGQQVQVRWVDMDVVSLAEPGEWSGLEWPALHLTDRLTIRLRGGGALMFRPAQIGLDPTICRDIILRLRDQPALRTRLPILKESNWGLVRST
jgi:hypothetical protein